MDIYDEPEDDNEHNGYTEEIINKYTDVKSNLFFASIKNFEPVEKIKEIFDEEYMNSHDLHFVILLEFVHSVIPCESDLEKNAYVHYLYMWLYQTLLERGVNLNILIITICKVDRSSKVDPIPVLDLLYKYACENNMVFLIDEQSINSSVNISFLEWWKDKLPEGYQAEFRNPDIITDVEIVRWWFESGFGIVLTDEYIRRSDYHVDPEIIQLLHKASIKVPIRLIEGALFMISKEEVGPEALDWLFQEYEDVITQTLMKDGSHFGYGFCITHLGGKNYNLLRYLHAKDIPFYYTKSMIDNMRNMEQAMFWERSGLPMKHTAVGLIYCIRYDVELGKWWLKNNLAYNDSYCVDSLIVACATEAMQFLVDHGIGMTCTEDGLNGVVYNKSKTKTFAHDNTKREQLIVRMIQLMIDSGMTLRYGDRFINKCLQDQMFQILELCYGHGNFPTEKDFGSPPSLARKTSRIDLALAWWLGHGLKIRISKKFLKRVSDKPEVIKLLEQHGYTIDGVVGEEDTEKPERKKRTLKN